MNKVTLVVDWFVGFMVFMKTVAFAIAVLVGIVAAIILGLCVLCLGSGVGPAAFLPKWVIIAAIPSLLFLLLGRTTEVQTVCKWIGGSFTGEGFAGEDESNLEKPPKWLAKRR